MAAPMGRSATAAAVVEQFVGRSAFTRPRPLPRAHVESLAALLFELCSGYETALRTVIAMQRNLERVRRGDEISPEAGLLLQEIARQLQVLIEGTGGLSDRLTSASHTVASAQSDA